ncbi:MAG: leucyl aminopeptidase family protein [Pseudomonadota bacterium]|nr:leucyl aminopeptidase family protein [Pseudomonadota bacterium]
MKSQTLARLTQHAETLLERAPAIRHLLILLPAGTDWHDAPEHAAAEAALQRQGKKADALGKTPLALELPGGCLSVWLRLDENKDVHAWHSLVRQALKPLLDEHPEALDIAVFGDEAFRARAAEAAAYVAWLNGATLPTWKSEKSPKTLRRIDLHGVAGLDLKRAHAVAEGNTLCRALTLLPPNVLNPATYRERIRALAEEAGWEIEEYDIKRLKKLKAGAFLAVARGSGHEDAAIVRLRYDGKSRVASGKLKTIALVGKGICFDTGGHNLKPARYMNNMHDDMNGSAVVLGILLAATRLKLPVKLEVWLAIAENHLSPEAYTQNEVVTALNGTTIEIVHTDAEGRMVLADALALAAQAKPAAIIDFATLTGSMAVALGERMSGVISNRDDLAARAVAAGQASGERVVAFPMPEDYDEALDSTVADVKQCTLDSEADHILAARFLNRFVGGTPWLHVDLSASRCKGGLGAAATDINGFGVGLGLALLM